MRWSIRVVIVILVLGGVALVAGRSAAAPPPPSTRIFLPHVIGDHCGDFYDEFTAPTGWFIGQRDGLLAELRGGEYRLNVTQPGLIWLVGAPDCPRVANHAAVSARWAGTSGNFYGLLFGQNGRIDNTYILAVNSDVGVWLLLRLDGGTLQTVIGPTSSDAIEEATNRLAITRGGGRILFSINDSTVGQMADTQPDAPYIVGLVAASYTDHAPADARFDRFVHRGHAVGNRSGDPSRDGDAWAEPLSVANP